MMERDVFCEQELEYMCVSSTVQISASLLDHIMNNVVLLEEHASRKNRIPVCFLFSSFIIMNSVSERR